MGSATREALVGARKALDALNGADGLVTGQQLFEAARIIGSSAQLRSMFADPAASAADKTSVVGALFTTLTPQSRALLSEIVSARWSTQDDLLAGIEEIAIRAVARSAPAGVSVDDELFSFGAAVSSDAALELAVGSKLGSAASKSTLITSLIGGKASEQTLAIVDHLVQQPRGRRIGELVRTAAALVADEAGLAVATVISAIALDQVQLDRLRAGLARSYGRDLQLNLVIDPSIIGGIRVQIGDDVIDGSISTRLNDLRLTLAS